MPLQDLRPDVVAGRRLHLPVDREREHLLRRHAFDGPQGPLDHHGRLLPFVVEEKVHPRAGREELLHRPESLDRSGAVPVQTGVDDARVPGGRKGAQDDHQPQQHEGQRRAERRVLEAGERHEQDCPEQADGRNQRQRASQTERRDRHEADHQVRQDDPQGEEDDHPGRRTAQDARPLSQERQRGPDEERRGQHQGQGGQRHGEQGQARPRQERREMQVEQGDLRHQVHRSVGGDRGRRRERRKRGEGTPQTIRKGRRQEDPQGERQQEDRPGRGARPEGAADDERQRPVPQQQEAPGGEGEQGHGRAQGPGRGDRGGRRVILEARPLGGLLDSGQGGADRPRTFEAALPQQDAPRRGDPCQRQTHQGAAADAERGQDQGSRHRQAEGPSRKRQSEREAEAQPRPFGPGGDETREDRDGRAVERRRQGEHARRQEETQRESADRGVAQDRPEDKIQRARHPEDAD